MKKIVWVMLALLMMTGCQDEREMAPDDITEEQTYAQKSDVQNEK